MNSLIFLCEYLEQDTRPRAPAKKWYSAADMILQCSVFTDPLTFRISLLFAELQECRILLLL